MLIDSNTVKNILNQYDISINGILHVGAHECEEKNVYNNWGIEDKDIVWVDANSKLIEQNKAIGIPNCYTSVLDEVERNTTFNITNNGQSSSLLDFGTHSNSYPSIVINQIINVKTETLNQFFIKNKLDYKKYNFWNFDIQGVELQVFRGSKELLQYVDCIYVEVNTGEVYKGCGLMDDMDILLKTYGLVRVMTNMTSANWGDAIYIRVEKSKSSYGTMTVAIPTYKRYKHFLEKNIPLYLDMPQIDTILIGDETGEDIEEIIKQPWGSNPKLVLIKNNEIMGAYHNKINLLKQVKTDWVALIDSDNQLLPEYFDGLYSYWDKNGPNTKMVYIPASVVSVDVRNGPSYNSPIESLGGFTVDNNTWNSFLNIIASGYGLNLGNCVFPKSACGIFPESFEKNLMVECKVMNKILVENDFTLNFVAGMKYFHIVHDGSLYLSKCREMQEFDRITKWTL